MQWDFAVLAVLQTLVLFCDTVSLPVIANEGSYSYIPAVLQVLFHMPSIRERMKQPTPNSKDYFSAEGEYWRTQIADVFDKMQLSAWRGHTHKGIVISNFYHACDKLPQNYHMNYQKNQDDDAQKLFKRLGKAMTWLAWEFFEMADTLIVWKEDGNTGKPEYEKESLTFHLGPFSYEFDVNDSKTIQESMAERFSLEYKFLPTKHWQRVFTDSNMLAVNIVASGNDASIQNKVEYPEQIVLDCGVFILHALVILNPGARYTVYVCTDVLTDTWHHFDGVSVTEGNRMQAFTYRSKASILYYVRDTELEDWKRRKPGYTMTTLKSFPIDQYSLSSESTPPAEHKPAQSTSKSHSANTRQESPSQSLPLLLDGELDSGSGSESRSRSGSGSRVGLRIKANPQPGSGSDSDSEISKRPRLSIRRKFPLEDPNSKPRSRVSKLKCPPPSPAPSKVRKKPRQGVLETSFNRRKTVFLPSSWLVIVICGLLLLGLIGAGSAMGSKRHEQAL